MLQTTGGSNKLETTVAATDSTAEMVVSHAGDALDQQFDASYETFQSSMERFENHIDETIDPDTSYLSVVSWVSIVLLISLLVHFVFSSLQSQQKSGKMVIEHEARLEQQGKAVTTLSTFIEAISAGNYTADLRSGTRR